MIPGGERFTTCDATSRVGEGVSSFCLAVVYPAELRHIDSLAKLSRSLARTPCASELHESWPMSTQT